MRWLLQQQALTQPLHVLLTVFIAGHVAGLKPLTFYPKERGHQAWMRFEASLQAHEADSAQHHDDPRTASVGDGQVSLGQALEDAHPETASGQAAATTGHSSAGALPEATAAHLDKFLDTSDADDEVDCEECQGLVLNYHRRLRTSAYPQVWGCFLVLAGALLLWLLNDTTEYYFTPPLLYWSKRLQLRPEVAGATLLAIGNGAPDLSDAIAAANAEDLPLALSELLGSNAFCLTCTVAACVLARLMTGAVKRDEMAFDRGRFLESLAWYSIGLATLLYILADAKVTFHEAVILPVVYCGYVIRLLLATAPAAEPQSQGLLNSANDGGYGAADAAATAASTPAAHDPRLGTSGSSGDGGGGGAGRGRGRSSGSGSGSGREDSASVEKAPEDRIFQDSRSLSVKCKVLDEGYYDLAGLSAPRDSSLASVVVWIILWPVYATRWITIPPSDAKWDCARRMICAICPVGLDVFCMVTGLFYVDTPPWPIASFHIALAMLVGLGLYCTSDNTPRLPWFYPGVTLVAKVSSIFWLGLIAGELMAILKTAGFYYQVSRLRLGFSVIAWGNTIGDFMTCAALAHMGHSPIAFTGVIAGPLFNDLIGLGAALLVLVWKRGPTTLFEGGWPNHIVAPMGGCVICISCAVLVMAAMAFLDPRAASRTWPALLGGSYLVFLAFMWHSTKHVD